MRSGARMPDGSRELLRRKEPPPLVVILPKLKQYPAPAKDGTLKFEIEDDPMSLHWPVKGLECVLIWPDHDWELVRTERIVKALFRYHAPKVTVHAGPVPHQMIRTYVRGEWRVA